MMGHRDRLKTGDEYDLASRARRALKFMRRPGVTAAIKAAINRRLRRDARAAVEEQREDLGEMSR